MQREWIVLVCRGGVHNHHHGRYPPSRSFSPVPQPPPSLRFQRRVALLSIHHDPIYVPPKHNVSSQKMAKRRDTLMETHGEHVTLRFAFASKTAIVLLLFIWIVYLSCTQIKYIRKKEPSINQRTALCVGVHATIYHTTTASSEESSNTKTPAAQQHSREL